MKREVPGMLLSDPDSPDKEKEQQTSGDRGNYSNSLGRPSHKDSIKNHATAVTPWHSLGTEEIFKKLVTSAKGLDSEEAAVRLQRVWKKYPSDKKVSRNYRNNSLSV